VVRIDFFYTPLLYILYYLRGAIIDPTKAGDKSQEKPPETGLEKMKRWGW
jgi:hypothetical protein